jgi:predicted transcriptional regulator YdeE
MKFLKYIFLFLMIITVVLAVYLGTLDGEYDVRRTRSIKADPVVVFNDLNDYENWKDWGPWFEKDSTLRVQYQENTIGEGAAYSWTSEIEEGGKMRTISVSPYSRIDQEIFFETPFGEMRSEVYWILERTEGGTDLTWGIKGELPFLSRFMASSMEEQMGPMEERGLELFNESIQKKLTIFSIEHEGVVDYSGGFYLYLTTSTKIDEMDLVLQEMMQKLDKYVASNAVRLMGSPFTIYHKYDQENGTAMFSVAYPISERIITEKGSKVLTGFMERGKYFKTVLKGSYQNATEAWEEAYSEVGNLTNFRMLDTGESFEVYVNNMGNTPNPADLVTEIYLPVVVNDIMMY